MGNKEKLDSFLKGYSLILETIKGYPKELMEYKPAPEKWSINEIVVHLADSEANSFVRLRSALAENGKGISPYDQDKWAVNLRYASQDSKENLELFKLLRITTHKMLSLLPEANWNNYFDHPERGKISVDAHILEMIQHVDTHIRQINRNKEAWKLKS